MSSLQVWVESKIVEKFVIGVIILNAIVLGLETWPWAMASFGPTLLMIDRACLIFFTVELLLKMTVYRSKFFHDPWRIFDLMIVAIALVPATGSLSALRAFRAFRLLRMISVLPNLRQVVTGLLGAIPSLGAVMSIMGIIFYVASVVATKLFGQDFPDWFGSIGSSAFSLFQVMTLESWSMGIARVVMEKYPYAWAFFIPFILVTTFTMLNLFVAVIVSSMQAESESHAKDRAEEAHLERKEILARLASLEKLIENMKK